MDFEPLNYDIQSKLPEWLKDDLFLNTVSKYSRDVITEIVREFLKHLGVLQPWMVWKTLPEEYDWEHNYSMEDEWLAGNDEYEHCYQQLKLDKNQKIVARVPNTKRKCHGIIDIQLKPSMGVNKVHRIQKLILRNGGKLTTYDVQISETETKTYFKREGGQKIIIEDIDTNTHIRIDTKNDIILINGAENSKKVSGTGFNKIHSTNVIDPKSDDLYIYDENAISEIEIEEGVLLGGSYVSCECDLSIKLIDPVYVTEQNIRVNTVSAFPLASVRLYGYYCFEHNNKSGWLYLFEKTYSLDDKVVYDRITKQYDCEIFYIEVEYHGVPNPIKIGFPQEEVHSDRAFETNTQLDSWGRVYNIPRRYFKTEISEDEEKTTYPKYYPYAIEQDFWYERRLLNEYKYSDEATNGIFIKDNDGTNIAYVDVIDPYVEDIYMYTESIPAVYLDDRTNQESLPSDVVDTHTNERAEFVNYINIQTKNDSYATCTMNRKDEDSFNDESFMSDVLTCYFKFPSLPHNINIKGAELKLVGDTNQISNEFIIDTSSCIYLPTKKEIGEQITWTDKKVRLEQIATNWTIGNSSMTVGGKKNFFTYPLDEEVKVEQIEKGCLDFAGITRISNSLRLDLVFKNNDRFNIAVLLLKYLELHLYYEEVAPNANVFLDLSKTTLKLNETEEKEKYSEVHFTIENTGPLKLIDNYSFLIIPPEFKTWHDGQEITGENKPITIKIDALEKGDKYEDVWKIYPTETGYFDIILINDFITERKTITVV